MGGDKRGLYETLITEGLAGQLGELEDRLEARHSELEEAEAPDRIALHLSRIIERAFYFLGPATYVKHESEMPMAITWRLLHPLPGDLFASFAAAVA